MNDLKAVHLQYRGRVQGVGFRFTVLTIARPLRITGYVRNMPDGSVEIRAEGPESDLNELIKLIRHSQLAPFIRNQSVNWHPPDGTFDSFTIKY